MKPIYPSTRTVEQVDNYHGTLVPDPYRWLEDVDSEETLEWIRQQACQSGDAPVLIRIQTKAGHGFGKPTTIQIEEHSDIFAFLWNQLRSAACPWRI